MKSMGWLIKEINELNWKSINVKLLLILFLFGLNYFIYLLIIL